MRFSSVYVILLSLTLLAGTVQLLAEAPLPDADDIVARVNARNEGSSSTQDLTIELTDRRGKTRIRETRGFRKDADGVRRTVLFFLSPNNIRNTAFLTFDHTDGEKEDDQWLYVPALGKVRRISAASRGDYFLGTDFTYDDVKNQAKIAAQDYHFKTLRRETLDGREALVVEGLPISDQVAEELGYGRVLMWIDPELWMSRKSELWDHHGKSLKTMQSHDIKEVDGIWTAHRLDVTHHQTGHKTLFTFSNIRYNVEIDDSVFSEGALRRGL